MRELPKSSTLVEYSNNTLLPQYENLREMASNNKSTTWDNDEYKADSFLMRHQLDGGDLSLLTSAVRSELRATLLSMATDTPSSPLESLISPSDLRRSLHTVDPTLSVQEVKVLTRHLLGGYSPQRIRIGKVLNALDML